VLAALIAVAGYLAWLQQKPSLQAQAEQTLRAVAKLKSDEVTDWLAERTGDAKSISGDPSSRRRSLSWSRGQATVACSSRSSGAWRASARPTTTRPCASYL